MRFQKAQTFEPCQKRLTACVRTIMKALSHLQPRKEVPLVLCVGWNRKSDALQDSEASVAGEVERNSEETAEIICSQYPKSDLVHSNVQKRIKLNLLDELCRQHVCQVFLMGSSGGRRRAGTRPPSPPSSCQQPRLRGVTMATVTPIAYVHVCVSAGAAGRRLE